VTINKCVDFLARAFAVIEGAEQAVKEVVVPPSEFDWLVREKIISEPVLWGARVTSYLAATDITVYGPSDTLWVKLPCLSRLTTKEG